MLKLSAKILAMFSISSLMAVGCSQDTSQSAPQNTRQQDWSMQIIQDTCSVSEITEEYLDTNAQEGSGISMLSLFRQDKNAMLRGSHFYGDKHLLEYISEHDDFVFTPNCLSDFSAVPYVNGDRFGSTRNFQFFSNENRELCHFASFERRYPSGGERTGIRRKGEVRTCHNIDTGRNRFRVIDTK